MATEPNYENVGKTQKRIIFFLWVVVTLISLIKVSLCFHGYYNANILTIIFHLLDTFVKHSGVCLNMSNKVFVISLVI